MLSTGNKTLSYQKSQRQWTHKPIKPFLLIWDCEFRFYFEGFKPEALFFRGRFYSEAFEPEVVLLSPLSGTQTRRVNVDENTLYVYYFNNKRGWKHFFNVSSDEWWSAMSVTLDIRLKRANKVYHEGVSTLTSVS